MLEQKAPVTLEADSEMTPNGAKARECSRQSEKPYINRKSMDLISKQGMAYPYNKTPRTP